MSKPQKAVSKTTETYSLTVGHLEVSAELAIDAAFRGKRKYFEPDLAEFLIPYNADKNKTMNRHDASMVCKVLTQKLQGYGVTFERPFSVNP